MAGTTTNFAFPYPTGTDSINTGDTKIQELADSLDSFISGSEAVGKLWDIKVDNTDATTYTVASGTTSFASFGSSVTYTFTTGKSGLFEVKLTGNFNNTTTAANGMALAYDISGGLYTAALGEAQVVTGRGGATLSRFHDGTGSTSYTITLKARTVTSTGTLTLYNHGIQVITYG